MAIAAAAAFFVFATTARAGNVDMVMDEAASSLSYSGSTVDLSFAVAKAPPGTVVVPYTASTNFAGNGANGLVAHYKGHLSVNLNGDIGGSIDLLTVGKGYQLATGSAPVTFARGAYIPNMNPNDTSESPQGSPSGSYGNPNFGGAPVDLGNYGITVSAVGAFARVWDQNISPSSDILPNGSLPWTPGPVHTFSVAPQMWEQVNGYQGLVSGLGNDLTNLANALGASVGFPIPLGGDLGLLTPTPTFVPNATTGTWNETTQTLTLNVNGTVTYYIDTANVIIDRRVLMGTLVYHPAVPEPSTMVLAGCGVVGLLGAFVRSRKRKPLVA